MKLTSDLFADFLKCPTKCYLHSTGQAGTGNAYAEWVREQNEAYRNKAAQRLVATADAEGAVTAPDAANLKTATWRLAVDLKVETGTMESRLHAVERVPSQGRGKPVQFIPLRFVLWNKLTKDDRLLIAFDSFGLSEALGREIRMGKIIHGDEHVTSKVKLPNLLSEARKLTPQVTALLADGSPPDLILNRHCVVCEFRDACRQKALERDDLSLLSNMTYKERKKFNSEGIFTLTQLSYTFRPRRRPKRLRDKREKYHHALKALAIRTKKIHIVGTPELKIEGTPVYLDVEALPDRDFYYLIGVRVGERESAVQSSLWADTIEDERKLWRDFLAILEAVEKPVLIHYGSFETTFVRRMSERYGEPPQGSQAAAALESAKNLLSFIFAQIYFPTFSNSLKDVGAWVGYKWSSIYASGIQSINWRMNWQQSGDPTAKHNLIVYNAEDCQALQLLSDCLVRLCSPDTRPNLESAAEPAAVLAESPVSKDTLWKRFTTPIEDFEVINKAARWDYQRDKVYIRTDKLLRRHAGRGPRRANRVNKEIVCAPLLACPICRRKRLQKLSQRTKTLYDIRFSKFGVRRWVVKYHFDVGWCKSCHRWVGVPEAFWPQSKYGRALVRFVAFVTVELCIPQRTATQGINRLFGLGLHCAVVNEMKSRAAEYYAETRQKILARMLRGALIHADETLIVLKQKRAYVWVFASFHEVAYFYTETREGSFVEQALKEFRGVLVSDFYAPYDSLLCPQQKCLLHLMRDLNDAVLDHPYDSELKEIVTGFGELLRGIVETIDRWGLKRRFLGKHLFGVDRLYRKISKTPYRSEAALKLKERFEKNRNGLFTFLSYDGVPWNNNNAEHAIKAFARLRRAIVGLSTAKGIEEYLVLLSICQTCKCSGLDFLSFLLSGETDIDAYAQKQARGKRIPPICPF